MNIAQLLRQLDTRPPSGPGIGVDVGELPTHSDPLFRLRSRAQKALFDRLGNRLFDPDMTEEQLHAHVIRELDEILSTEATELSTEERRKLVPSISSDILGLGPIEPYLSDPTVTEVMVNSNDAIFIERAGRLQLTDSRFMTPQQVRQVIEKIVVAVGRRIDESSPLVDARLPDGSRVNTVIPPLAIDGPMLTIRKFAETRLMASDLVRAGTLTDEAAMFLDRSVRACRNILISGGTGSGKTTLLNVVSSFIPEHERIVTIEDAVELRLDQRHVIRLEARPPNLEGKGEISIRDLVRNSLRMRPDRIVVGEVRGGEALDMLQAMNTGHDGSLSTLHANTPRDGLSRLETMVLMAGLNLPSRSIREQIASAVDLVVHLSRMGDGSRRVTEIAEVVGMEGESIGLSTLFSLDHRDASTGSARAGTGSTVGVLRPTAAGQRLMASPPGDGPGSGRETAWLRRAEPSLSRRRCPTPQCERGRAVVKRRGPRPIPPIASIGVVTLLALALLVGAGSGAAAETSTTVAEESPEPAEADRIQILGVDETEDEVILELAVPPAIGRLAPVDANFGVTDGGQLVDFVVAPVETAADTVMVLDTSGSMQGSALAAAKSAAVSFIQALPEDTRVGLIGFGDTVVTYRTPTLDRAGLLADIEGLSATGQQTLLWDALLAAADLAAGPAAANHSSIVVLSDGDDTASAAGPADVVRKLDTGSTALYAVAIESPDTDLLALEETVNLVGGQFLATTDIGQLDSLYTDIAGRLANRYRLRFAPAQQGTRTVVVSVAAGSSVATARVTIGGGVGGQPPAPGPIDRDPPPVLNIDEQPVLGAVVTPAAGWLSGPAMLGLGMGSMFAAFAIFGLIIVRPAAQVRFDTAAGVDRLGGISARLGDAADQLIARHDQGSLIDARLEAADVNMRPGEFVLAWLLAAVAAGLTLSALFGLAAGPVAVAASVAGGLLFLRVRANRRRSRFADQLTETLGVMAGSLRSGQSLPTSIELVSAEAPSPTAEEFHRIAFEVRVGRDLTESIRDAARRTASEDLEWVAQAVDINRELGGDLSEIMDNVAATIRERRTVARQIDALSAEGRATGWVLLAMPILLFLFSWWRTPDTVAMFMTEPIGRVLLIVAVTGMTVGHIWIRHLIKLKY